MWLASCECRTGNWPAHPWRFGGESRAPKEWHVRAQTPLTARQIRALRLINLGLSNQQIAEKLSITVGTTKWHLHEIFNKLKVHNRAHKRH
ncbi:MAG: response regulator transcription factor [Betaproteobacteria bacterium]|nr:MAG: response regulator transcription factor [Betaproteobacteria bacterium]